MRETRRIQTETGANSVSNPDSRVWTSVSPSQLSTAEMCSRKWWFEKIARLPVIQKDYFTFGTVFHGVVERWLKADASGRDETGAPVNIYPEGWDKEISKEESELIRVLVKDGIELGLLERAPGRQIEFEFSMPVEPGSPISMVGIIDLLTPTMVQDHKTTKDFRWALSEEKIKSNTQLLIYAKVLIAWLTQNRQPIPEKIEIRHNTFLKNFHAKKRTRLVSAFITPKEVEDAWNETVRKVRILQQIAEVKDWKFVPGPHENGACMKYGGCHFTSICCAKETVEVYSTRIRRYIDINAITTTPTSPRTKIHMGLLSKLSGLGGNSNSPATPAPPVVVNSPAPAVITTAPPAPPAPAPAASDPRLERMVSLAIEAGLPLDGTSAPGVSPLWANEDCQACEGLGFNSKKTKPCPVCITTCAAREVPLPDKFIIVALEGQEPSWRIDRAKLAADTEFQAAIIEALGDKGNDFKEVPGPSPKASKKNVPASTETQEYKAPDGVSTIVVSKTVEIETSDENKPEKGGRPSTTFSLYIDCAITQMPGSKYVNGDQLFREACDLVAKARGADFYSLDHFARRDALKVVMRSMLGDLKSHHVVVCHGTPDMNAMIEGLRENASLVVVGVK